MKTKINIFGLPLELCCLQPKTGYFRDGFCRTDDSDFGRHVVCAQVTAEFLSFSKSKGNDLITQRPEFDFPGLQNGDFWCLCAVRWKEALEAGVAPKIRLESCEETLLNYITLEELIPYALNSFF
jgi:uncharacterized protein (DUF2237 family)